jgi:NADH dehydrogenase (ubiquinone) flavoprotein 2
MKAIEEQIGVTPGHTTPDKMFTFTEVECLGACVNAPMVQINDDFFEDLTPETTKSLLVALKDAAEKTGAGGMAPGLPGMSGQEEASGAGGEGKHIPGQRLRSTGRQDPCTRSFQWQADLRAKPRLDELEGGQGVGRQAHEDRRCA